MYEGPTDKAKGRTEGGRWGCGAGESGGGKMETTVLEQRKNIEKKK